MNTNIINIIYYRKSLNLCFIIFILSIFNCKAQNAKTDSLFQEFRKNISRVQEFNLEFEMMDETTEISYCELMKQATFDDLVKYGEDSIAIVRAYMLKNLLMKSDDENLISSIFEKHKKDSSTFFTHLGCFIKKWTVSEFIYTGLAMKCSDNIPKIDYDKRLKELKKPKTLELKIDKERHGFIEKSTLLSLNKLELTNDEFVVISFRCIVGEKIMNSNSAYLTYAMKEAIRQAKSGTIISFEEIKFIGSDKLERKLVSTILRIK